MRAWLVERVLEHLLPERFRLFVREPGRDEEWSLLGPLPPPVPLTGPTSDAFTLAVMSRIQRQGEAAHGCIPVTQVRALDATRVIGVVMMLSAVLALTASASVALVAPALTLDTLARLVSFCVYILIELDQGVRTVTGLMAKDQVLIAAVLVIGLIVLARAARSLHPLREV